VHPITFRIYIKISPSLESLRAFAFDDSDDVDDSSIVNVLVLKSVKCAMLGLGQRHFPEKVVSTFGFSIHRYLAEMQGVRKVPGPCYLRISPSSYVFRFVTT
jgi:hypothetical protein